MRVTPGIPKLRLFLRWTNLGDTVSDLPRVQPHRARPNALRLTAWRAAALRRDAALKRDPLSAQGLLNALFTGLASAEAAHRYLSECDVALGEFVRTVRGIREAYGSHLTSWYKAEVRWPNSQFWRRRQSGRYEAR